MPDKSQDGRRVENNPPPEPPRHEQAAIADQNQAMELDPASPDPHLNRGTAAEVSQLRLDFHEEIRRFFLVDVEFAVAGDPKRVRCGQAVTGEQFSGAEFDDFAEKNDALRTASAGSDAHEAW